MYTKLKAAKGFGKHRVPLYSAIQRLRKKIQMTNNTHSLTLFSHKHNIYMTESERGGGEKREIQDRRENRTERRERIERRKRE